MNKVNFDNLKNIEAPEKWIENAINIPNTEQKKSPILALFSTKSSRLIAAAACLILVSAVALTIFLTQDRVTPPIDPNFSVTEPAVETQDVTQAQSDSSEQTPSSGDNKSDTTSSSEYEKTEPTESSTTAQNGISNSTQHNSTNAVVKPTAKPVEKETTAKATEPTEKLDDDKDDDEQSYPDSTPSGSTGKPSVKPIVKPTVKPTQAPVTEPTEEPVIEPTIEPTEEPVVKPTSKPNTPPAMLMLPTIPSPDFLPPENFDGPPSVTPTEPTPPEVSPTEPTEPPFVDPSEPPITETEPVSPTEPTTNPNDLPHYVIDVTNTMYCHIDDPVCVGYLDPPVHIGDDYYCSLYDKNLNVIGYYEHYYYSEYLKASIKPIYQENKIRCEYSLKYREMVTSIGTYYYCFYNDEGKIVYWGKMVVYE